MRTDLPKACVMKRNLNHRRSTAF